MANRILIISLCYLFALCSSCSKGPEIHTKPPVEIHADEKALIANEAEIVANAPKSSNKFAFDLYKDLATEESNLVFSPFSISLALAMTYAGAKGDTAAAIKKVFYFGDNTLDFHKSFGELASLLVSKDRKALDTKLMIANGLWLQSGFNVLQPFKNTLKVAYHSQLTELDFAHEPGPSTKKINVTVSEQTAGEIDKLLKQDLKKTTQFVITNAIYFKSKWRSPFEANKTAKRRFLKNNGQSVDTDFMMQTHRFPYGENEQKQFLMMPYKDADFAAFFILPRENQLASVENGLNDVSV
ncbi:MAG TPA: serpin family protein, partial [Myxococcota bacterium]|nr:serpin family protein [Myxococcota bacterium]